MSRMRQRVAQRLKDAQNTAAMLTTFQECDMSALMELRKTHQDEFTAKHGVKLGFMSAFVKAATAALQELPIVNAYIDGSEVVYRDYVDVSVAVASPTGLVVPVLRNTNLMGFADVERNIALYAQKAKDGALSLDDMAGGTFTISNYGTSGSKFQTPVIVQPQVGILGVGAVEKRAIVVSNGHPLEANTGDYLTFRPMTTLGFSYDHRVLDGATADGFCAAVKKQLEGYSV